MESIKSPGKLCKDNFMRLPPCFESNALCLIYYISPCIFCWLVYVQDRSHCFKIHTLCFAWSFVTNLIVGLILKLKRKFPAHTALMFSSFRCE